MNINKIYLVLGAGQSEPYSCTCIPKKQTSTPSISSKTKRALVRYGNWLGKPENLSTIPVILNKRVWLGGCDIT